MRFWPHFFIVKNIYRGFYSLIFVLQNIFFVTLVHAQQIDFNIFPRPVEMEPAIEFWVRVYTEVDTSNGFLHDSKNLSVIYARLDRDNQGIELRRQQIKDDLLVLATGKRTNLTSSQEDILKLWPDRVSNERLKTAINNVRWQLGQSNAFLDGLQRSGAYRTYIDEILQNKTLPSQLALLPHVESSFVPNAYSSADAAGMWQFTRPTGQRFMRIDHIVDERMDPYISASAAMDLLEYNYRILGTWPLALTAYNQGVGGMSRAVRETGTTAIEIIIDKYSGGRFGFVGRNFYAQFLAVNEVERDINLYFEDVRFDDPFEFIEVRLDAFIDAREFAKSVGTTIEQLRIDNPSLRNVVWQGLKRIPRGFRLKLRAKQFQNGNNLLARIDNDFKYSVQLPDIYYEVEREDNLQIIAEKFNTTVSLIANLNELRSRNNIQVGQRLMLPQGEPSSQNSNVLREEIVSAKSIELSSNSLETPDFYEDQPSENILSFDTIPSSRTGNQVISNQNQNLPDANSEEIPIENLDLIPIISSVSSANDQPLAIDIATNNSDLANILDTDPSNYSININGTIEVQASETISHIANWLDTPAWDIRRLNSMTFRDRIVIGKQLQLDFNKVSRANFKLRRLDFHSNLQRNFFETYQIKGSEEYEIKLSDNINRLAKNRYSAPLWLVRQYNPGINFNSIYAGQRVTFPLLKAIKSLTLN